VQVTFFVTDYEIISTAIRNVLLLWHVQKLKFLAKVKSTGTGKQLESLPGNDTVVELCSCKFNVAHCAVKKSP
jgi:hypothetical protein